MKPPCKTCHHECHCCCQPRRYSPRIDAYKKNPQKKIFSRQTSIRPRLRLSINTIDSRKGGSLSHKKFCGASETVFIDHCTSIGVLVEISVAKPPEPAAEVPGSEGILLRHSDRMNPLLPWKQSQRHKDSWGSNDFSP